jgi:ribosomal protein L30/L7E
MQILRLRIRKRTRIRIMHTRQKIRGMIDEVSRHDATPIPVPDE